MTWTRTFGVRTFGVSVVGARILGEQAEQRGGESAGEGDDGSAAGVAEVDALLREDSGDGNDGDEQAGDGGFGVVPDVGEGIHAVRSLKLEKGGKCRPAFKFDWLADG
jgi:hypothetical protein